VTIMHHLLQVVVASCLRSLSSPMIDIFTVFQTMTSDQMYFCILNPFLACYDRISTSSLHMRPLSLRVFFHCRSHSRFLLTPTRDCTRLLCHHPMTSMITFYCLLLQIVRVVKHSMISHVPSVTLHSHAVRNKFVESPCLNLPRNPH
jgi:hypothetical protein